MLIYEYTVTQEWCKIWHHKKEQDGWLYVYGEGKKIVGHSELKLSPCGVNELYINWYIPDCFISTTRR